MYGPSVTRVVITRAIGGNTMLMGTHGLGMATIELESEKVDGACSIHDCDNDSQYLWRVVDIETGDEEVRVNTVLAEYCPNHSQSHAEIGENLHYIGRFELVD